MCGQTCVAMAAGVTLREAIRVVGHRRHTEAAELRAALRALGVRTARLRRVSERTHTPARAIVGIERLGKQRVHWMLAWDGEMHDPDGLWPHFYAADWRWRITWYIEIP